jgi:hypothetical protein
MKFSYLLGILSFALISQASGAGLSLSPSSASIGPNGVTNSFFVNESHSSFGGNGGWRWTREASWVSPQESTNQNGDQTFTYIVAPNPSTSSRTTRIRVVKDGGLFDSDVTRYFTINQSGLIPTLSLTSSSRDFSAAGGGSGFTVTSNTNWRWSGKPSWVTANESSSQTGNQSFSYSVFDNTSTSSRSATLTFTTASGGNTQTRTHRITQDPAPSLSLNAPSRNFSAASGSYGFSVNSNTTWRWSGKPSWVSTTESSSQTGNQTFSYSVSPNTSPSSRSVTLTFTTTGPGNTVTRTHRITQDPAPTLSLSASSRDFSAASGSYGFTVNSNTTWRWSGKPSWVTANESTSQTGNQSFSYSVSPNTSPSSRSVTLTFTTTGAGSTVTRTHRISQDAAPTLSLNATSTSPPSNGGNRTISVSSNTSWRWSDNATWVTSTESTTQSGTQSFSFSWQPNTSASSRTARITFTTTGAGSTVTRTHTINQGGITPALTLSTSTRNFSAAGGNYGFTVNSNISWQWSGKPSWVSSTESTSQTGNQVFSYIVQPNTKTSSRSATLTFTTTSGGNKVTRTHTISQDAAADTVPPVITRIGPPTSTIEASREAEYTDQGATCLDEVDGVLNQAVEVSGDVVNLRQPGTYIIRYNCEDSAGNEADEVIRTILVKDTLPPVITLTGDDTVNVEAGFAYQDPGAGAEDSLDGNVNVSIDDTGVDTGVVGNHTVTYTASDAAENTAEASRTVKVRDTLPPVITLHLQDRPIHVGEHGQLGINDVVNAPAGLPVEDEGLTVDNATRLGGAEGPGTIRETPFTQPDGTPVVSRQNWVMRAGAGEEHLRLPIARAWDHVDSDLAVSTTITLIDLDGNTEETVVSEVDFSRRSTYLFRYDARDSAGNYAEQAAIALILDDQQAPVISLEGNGQEVVEASSAWTLPGASATDNIDGELNANIRYQVDEVSNSASPVLLGEDLTHAQASALIDTSTPGKYLVTLRVNDEAGIYGLNNSNNQATARRQIQVRDTLPPVITLTGDQTVSVEAGFPYQDAGATAADAVDGDITVTIDDTGVDTNVVGSYTITYNVTDAAGNETEVTRTVKVILTQAPVITNLVGVGAPKTLSAVSITFASYLNADYIIERSRDLENWEGIREIQGEAQSTTVTIDEPIPDGGGVYYRVGVKIN